MTRKNLRWFALALALAAAFPAAAQSAPPAGAPAAAPAKPRRAAPAAAAAPAATRRLDEVRIEGELEVPRVTFITVRQPHRFHDYTRATSVRPARKMAAEATFPGWIPSPSATASEARKENRK